MSSKGSVTVAVLAAALALAGCSAQYNLDEPNTSIPALLEQDTIDDPTEADTSDFESSPVAETPFAEDPEPAEIEEAPEIGAAGFHVTIEGGFESNVSITWHELADVSPAELGDACIDSWISSSTDLSTLAFKAVRVSVSVDYPEVNGFVWPEDTPLLVNLSDTQGYDSSGSTCAEGVAPKDAAIAHKNLPSPSSGGGTLELTQMYRTHLSPDAPEGDWDIGLENLTITLAVGAEVRECKVAGATNLHKIITSKGCEVAYPVT